MAAASEALTPEIMSEVTAAEAQIRRRLPIGSRTSVKRIVEELQRQVCSTLLGADRAMH
jgi:hypothetical protein